MIMSKMMQDLRLQPTHQQSILSFATNTLQQDSHICSASKWLMIPRSQGLLNLSGRFMRPGPGFDSNPTV